MIQINKSFHSMKPEFLENATHSLNLFLNRTDIGFSHLCERESLWKKSQEVGSRLSKDYQSLVLVGIGGSSLGVRVIAEVFGKKNIYFVDNVDSIEFSRVMLQLDLKNTCWVFASKSGTTIETLCALEVIEKTYQDQGINLYQRAAVITENKPSSLFQWAQKHSIPVAEISLDVGGRFSVLSPVGMLPAAYMGLNIQEFKEGAALAISDKENVARMIAETMMSFERNEWITLFWPYTSLLKNFGLWYQQLWAESLGKKQNKQGQMAPRASTPMSAVGATDQHSILQQVMEGYKDKFVLFMRVDECEKGEHFISHPQFSETQLLRNKTMGQLLAAEAMATQEAMSKMAISNLTFQTKVLNEKTLGYLLMFFQLVVAGLGEALGINAFDQPGVELGKSLAKEKLKAI